MVTAAAPDLLHIVGFLTGAALYTMLLAMVVRAPSRGDQLMVVTALLGLVWNLGEVAVYVARYLAWSGAVNWISAGSYAALGLLAAVVVHSVARGAGGGRSNRTPTIARLAYACATLAGIVQLIAAANDAPLPSAIGLLIVTIGLIVLAPALILSTRGQAQDRRAFWMTAMAIFAVSALHLIRFHGAQESGVAELLGHHASIPLAFAILYQDYRFALADLFLKQAVTLLALVSLIVAAWLLIAPAFTSGAPTPGAVGMLLGAWMLTALFFPFIRRGVTVFIDRVVLKRASYSELLDTVASAIQECDSEDTALGITCQALAPALSATNVKWEPRDSASAVNPHETLVLTAEEPQYGLVVGQLAGGRRLLSDDLSMLERVAFLLARRIDALRLTNERYERMLREREISTLVTEAELRALRAQINPHFLFNAMTTLGYLIQSAPSRALDTLLRLTTLLRSVLRSEGEFTTLGHEQEMIKCYLDIEQERFEERLRVTLDIPGDLSTLPIPSLIVQPLVENAIKHGIACAREGGAVTVTARRYTNDVDNGLSIRVVNTGAPLHARAPSAGTGVGLHNVEQRLRHYYGTSARLTLTTDPSGATVAELIMPAGEMDVDRPHDLIERSHA